MNDRLFNDGDKVILNNSTLVHVVVNGSPDDEGFIVVTEARSVGRQYRLIQQSWASPHTETIHVQLRVPEVGETILAYHGEGAIPRGGEITLRDKTIVNGERYVIVGRS